MNQLMEKLVKHSIFKDTEGWIETKSVWARPIRPQSFKGAKFEKTNLSNKFNYSAFTMNRALTALNEQDFLYLPETSENIIAELKNAYNPSLRENTTELIPKLEEQTLAFLNEQIQISKDWTKNAFIDYFRDKVELNTSHLPESFEVIRQSKNPKRLAEMLVIQHAVDFLPESSHMTRYGKGDFGPVQSALFRVLIDEFGYGKHAVKHSTLFKHTLASMGLESNSHAYWMFYLNASLLNNNYFHSITKKAEKFFEYVGAITYAENTFGPYCSATSDLLQECYGDSVDVRYYKEHKHIDKLHGSMTLDEILLPLIDQYGNEIIPEVVKGIEVSSILQEIMEEDLFKQLDWMEKKSDYIDLALNIKEAVLSDASNLPVAHLDEPLSELSVAHVHDGDEFCIVDKGLLRFCHGHNCFTDLGPGDCVVIKKNRLHGALVLSESCNYRILSIGDYKKYGSLKIQ